MNNKIIERIKKMFALANCKGASAGEAENAFCMATKLMERHNLSSMDLHTKEEISFKFGQSARQIWIGKLTVYIAEVYNCTVFLDQNKKCVIVGAMSDIITTKIVTEGLIQSIKRAGKGKGAEFKNGAVMEIFYQCHKIIKEREKKREIHPGSGLVLVDIYKTKTDNAREFMNSMANLRTKKPGSCNYSKEGQDYGKTLNPYARVNKQQTALN